MVLEGNRRLAALRLLSDAEVRNRLNYLLPRAGENSEIPIEIRVRVVADRKEARNFIAFKHINGPAKWDALAKARYSKDWLSDGSTIDSVADAVGDNHNTVLRLVNGLTILEQAVQSGFDKFDITAKSFNFSHLYTALARPAVRAFLQLPDDVAEVLPEKPVPVAALDNLGKLMGLLYGQAKQGLEHVVRSQNPDLGKLVRILTVPRAMKILEEDRSLRLAFEEVEPASNRFEDSLRDAALISERTLGLVSHFNPATQLVLIDTVDKLASSVRLLRNEMRDRVKKEDDL